MEKIYPLQKNGYEPFLDFLKGLCILCVIWEHGMPFQRETLFCFWGKLAVPLFLVIQCFHVFKKESVTFPCFFKLYKRILRPFIFASLVILVIKYSIGDFQLLDGSFWLKAVRNGGWGPGCYYPWIYLQIALLAPAIFWLLKGKSQKFIFTSILIFSFIGEMLFTYLGGTEKLWRILAIRYFFLMAIAFSICEYNIRLTKFYLSISIIGIISIALFEYLDFRFTPFFYDSEFSWRSSHWICFFYIYLFLYLLRAPYEQFPETLKTIISCFGKASYEVFLVQMIVFATIGEHAAEIVDSLGFHGLFRIVYLSGIWLLSLGGGISLYYVKKKVNKSNIHLLLWHRK